MRTGGWKTSSWLSRCLLFMLGLFAAAMAGGTFALLPGPRLLVAGFALAGLAEFLIRRRHVLRPGFEEALYACGAAALAAQLAIWTGRDAATGALLLALCLGVAGLRLLNPLFTTIAALLLSAGVALLAGEGGPWQARAWAGSAVCGLLALAALTAAARCFARPAHDHMLDGLVFAMPAAASLWLLTGEALLAAPVALSGGVLCLVVGIRRRSHAALFAALLQIPCLAWSLHQRLPLAPHWQLIAWGAVVLAVVLGAERLLARHSSGFEGLEALPLAAAGGQSGTSDAGGAPDVEGEGGAFGGGGASGRF